MITRCIMCCRDEIVKDMVFIEPLSKSDSAPMYYRGWICDNCSVIHWAWEFDEKSCPSDIGGIMKDETE